MNKNCFAATQLECGIADQRNGELNKATIYRWEVKLGKSAFDDCKMDFSNNDYFFIDHRIEIEYGSVIKSTKDKKIVLVNHHKRD